MPHLFFKDRDSRNISIENLRIAEKGELIKEVSKNNNLYKRKIELTRQNVDFVNDSLLKEPGNLIAIAAHFNCNSMSVLRFIRKINKDGKWKINYISKYNKK